MMDDEEHPLSRGMRETRGGRGLDRTKIPQGLGKGFSAAAVDRRTLQICHVESTHCNPVNSHLSISDLDLDILPGTSPSAQEYPTQCGKQIRLCQGY
jgi:hypothetical protein